MDFIDQLKTLAKKLETRGTILNEESTKTSLIMPFIKSLGYDVFDCHEVRPEYCPGDDMKSSEKVDYAIMQNGLPIILVEAKPCNETLEKYTPQLFKYYAASNAKVGILTNGVMYQFYCDLDKENLLDKEPFFIFDLGNINDTSVEELKKFRKDHFDSSKIQEYAHVLRYQSLIIRYLQKQLTTPEEDFVKFVIKSVCPDIKRLIINDEHYAIVKNAFNQFINFRVESILKTAMQQNVTETAANEVVQPETTTYNNGIETTLEEIAFYNIIKGLLSEAISIDRITYNDTKSYFAITLDNMVTKWVCRISKLNIGYKIEFPAKYASPDKFNTESELIKFKETILKVASDLPVKAK